MIAIEAKRNCVRVTERGEAAWSETASRRTGSGYEAQACWGERARKREAPIIKGTWSRSDDCAGKVKALTWGDLASGLKGPRCARRKNRRREVSRGRSSER